MLVFSEDEAAAERGDIRAPGVQSILGITADGKIKCVSEKNFNMSNKAVGEKSKAGSVLVKELRMLSDAPAFIFSDKGNCFKIYPQDYLKKFGDEGYELTDLFEGAEKGETPVSLALADVEEGNLLFITESGMLKKTARSEYNTGKPFFPAIRLNEGDRLISVQADEEDEFVTVFFVTRGGMCLNAKKDDIPLQGRIAGGVKGMNLKEGDKVVFASQIDGEGEIVVAISGGRYKRVITAQIDPLPRYRKGVQIASLKNDDKVIFADYVTVPYLLAAELDGGGMCELSTEDIPIDATNTRGRTLKGVKRTARNVYPMKYREAE